MPSDATSMKRDTVFLRDLSLYIPVGKDAWHRLGKPQAVLLSLRIAYDVTRAAASDDVAQTLDYGKLCKLIYEMANGEKGGFCSLDDFSLALLEPLTTALKAKGSTSAHIEMEVRLPKAILRADGGLRLQRKISWRIEGPFRDGWEDVRITMSTERLKCACIIGVNPHERVERQTVVLSLSTDDAAASKFMKCYDDATRVVVERVEGSSFQTVESLASFVCRTLTGDFQIDECTVSVEKPSALANVKGAGVEITRSRAFFSESEFWASGNHRLGET